MSVRIITVTGDHYAMGQQHGHQVRDLRPQIVEAMEQRLRATAGLADADRLVEEAADFLHAEGRNTLDLIRGQAEALDLDFDRLLRYDLASYLEDRLLLDASQPPEGSEPSRGLTPDDGCSTWGATGGATCDGQPILVKNRDYSLAHLPLQILVRSEPAGGYCHLQVGSAGSPHVFSSGINEVGLAVVDSRVRSTDVGPGLPTYALMMTILEEHSTVRSALDYLRSVRRMGGSNLLLADAGGDLAVFEVGHRGHGVIEAEEGLAVSTNHYVCPALSASFRDTNPPATRGNSFKRRQKLVRELVAGHGQIDIARAQALMADHDGPLASLCRHEDHFLGLTTSTISTAIYLPARRGLLFLHGRPCEGQYETFLCQA